MSLLRTLIKHSDFIQPRNFLQLLQGQTRNVISPGCPGSAWSPSPGRRPGGILTRCPNQTSGIGLPRVITDLVWKPLNSFLIKWKFKIIRLCCWITVFCRDVQGCPWCSSFHESSSFAESALDQNQPSSSVCSVSAPMLLPQQMTADETELSTTDL